MAFFRRSWAEDSIAGYSHSWGVMVLLLLSVITFLLPLSPLLHRQTNSVLLVKQQPPEAVQAQCWTPAHFSNNHIQYTNTICAAGFIKQLYGQNDSSTSIYHLDQNLSQPKQAWVRVSSIATENEQPDHQATEREDQLASDVNYLISVRTPLILFLLAVLFKIPHLIFALFSGLTSVNVHHSIETVLTSQRLDQASRHQLMKDLARVIANSASCSASLLYLVFKCLVFVVSLMALVTHNSCLREEMDGLNQDISTLGDHSQATTAGSVTTMASGPDNATLDDYLGKAFLCEFEIAQIQNIQSYVIQCVLNRVSWSPPMSHMSLAVQFGSANVVNLPLGIYTFVFEAVMVHLLVLVVVSGLSLLVWTFKMVLPSCRQRVSASKTLPSDLYLLLFMAWENAGDLAAADLAHHLTAASTGKQGEFPLSTKAEELPSRL